MRYVLYPHRWFVWTVVVSVITGVVLLWAITLYAIDIQYGTDSYNAQFLDTFNRLHQKHVEMSNGTSESKYRNEKYGFAISLPASWAGYTVVSGARELRSVDTGKVVATIPTIRIRHPKWQQQNPYEDIPVDVFTHVEWDKVQEGSYSAGAAPIPPTELGRNTLYVFGLPARYNYDYSIGWEEVEQILNGKPLSVFDVEIDVSQLHTSCKATNTCDAPFQCVSYYGIAGPQIPAFKTCELPCKSQSDCPSDFRCSFIADGPGQVCTK